ncbi:MAG: glycosyltransferase [Bacteroidia bacterium]
MKNHLHIVSFDVPYPCDYGGVIDIYHKIRCLNNIGVSITLHCFQYGRDEAKQLNKICKKVIYYKRSKYRNPFIGEIPYIVLTRSNDELLTNLCKDQSPILFEGIHTTFFLNHSKLKNRFKMVRNHNIEHDYYKSLEQVESNYFKKYFFRNESDKLKTYEKRLKLASKVLAISPSDHNYLNKKYHNSILIPAFHSNDSVHISEGTGKFVLYHGNLSVGENNFAALYLVNKVFSKIRIPCVIAGNNPSKELIKACLKHSHINLIDNWNNEQIMDAVANAHINVLPTFQATGIKLKLLNALYSGRFCLVNPTMVDQTTLEKACIIAKNSKSFIAEIENVWKLPFTEKLIQERRTHLENSIFENTVNANKIAELVGLKT